MFSLNHGNKNACMSNHAKWMLSYMIKIVYSVSFEVLVITRNFIN